jgi:two-component system cell cycle response regulator
VSFSTAAEHRVLVADENPAVLSALSWLLREQGYSVVAVEKCADIVTALEESKPDILVVDCEGYGDAGSRMLADIKRDDRWREIPVLVTTPQSTMSGRARPLPEGADDCISKPFRVPELLARIQLQLRAHNELRVAREQLRVAEQELMRARENVESNRRLVDILHEVTGELSSTEIYRILARRVARALDISHCSVVLARVGDATGTVAAAFEDQTIENLAIRLERYPEIVRALEIGRPVLVNDAKSDPLFADIRDVWTREHVDVAIRSVLTLPFSVDRWRAGVLFLRTERGERTLTREDAQFADVVVKAAVAAIKRAQALESTREDNRRLEALATTDPLTRLLNRRALLERLSIEVDRAHRYGSSLSLLLLDIDHFKAINDTAGHLVGDGVLRQLGELLAYSVRTADVVARYGGEEFVVILPETSSEGGVIFAERLRDTVERHAFDVSNDEPLHLTASIGVATFPSPRVESTEDLFARADEALYRAKSGGRNQVRT